MMHRNHVFDMLLESFEDNQGSDMDSSPLNSLSKSDAGDAEFMVSLLTEFVGFERVILEFLAEPAKSDVNFFNKFLEAGISSKPNWGYLRYASDSIKSDPSLFLEWIRESGGLQCLQFADQAVLKNAEITTVVTELIHENSDMIEFAPEELRDDDRLMKKVIVDNPLKLEFASERLKRDVELVLDAIVANAQACNFIDVTLYESESFVRNLIERVEIISPQTFRNIPDSIKRERQCLIDIAKKLASGSELEGYIDPADKSFFSEVMRVNGSLIFFASEDIKDDEDLAREAINGGASLQSVSERLRNDADFVCWAIERDRPAVLRRAGEKARDTRRVVLAAVSRQGTALDWASRRLQDDIEVVSIAVKEDPKALMYASERIRNDKEFVLRVCAIDIHAYLCAGNSLFSDREFAMFIAPKVVNSLEHFSAEIQDDALIQSIYINNIEDP